MSEEDHKVSLEVADYVVTGLLLLVPLGIGTFYAIKDSKKVTREEYLLGGRQMMMLPVTLSLFVTYQSAISLIGTPSETYIYGAMFSLHYLGIGMSYVIGILTLIPLMYPLHLTSIYEYIYLRFDSHAVRLLATLIGMLQNICYMAVALLSPALALQAAAGIPLWMSVAIVGSVGTVYTALGGIKSVIWTDAFQTVIVFMGIFTIIIRGCMSVGGLGEVFRVAKDGGRLTFDEVSPDPRTRNSMWGMLIGMVFTWLVNVFNQSTLQRISSLKTRKDANLSYLLNIPLNVFYGFSLFFVGIVVYAYFVHIRCDPFQAGFISNKNQMVPFFVLHTFKDVPGIAGLYMATLFSGALSTISSGINALAANTVEDLLKTPLTRVSEKTATLVTKVFVFMYGMCCIGLAYGANSLEGPVTQMAVSVFGACGSPVLGMFFLGGSVPWANKYGAMAGGITAIIFNIFIAVGGQIHGKKHRHLSPAPSDNCFRNQSYLNETLFSTTALYTNMSSTSVVIAEDISKYQNGFFLYDISYEWYAVIGLSVCIATGLIVSFLTKNICHSQPDSKLIFWYLRKFWRLPDPIYSETNTFVNLRSENPHNVVEFGKKPIHLSKKPFTYIMTLL